MRRGSAVVAVLGLFLLGVLAGSAGTHLFYVEKLRQPGGPPHMAGRKFGERMLGALDLTSDQQREIEAIIEDSHRRSASIREEMGPRVRALFDETNRRIREVLTDEQRAEFDRLRAEHRRRAEQFMLGPDGRGRRGPPRRPRESPE